MKPEKARKPHPVDITRLMIEGTQIDLAMRRAAREAVLRHKREGIPIVIERNGEMVELQPDEIQIEPWMEMLDDGPKNAPPEGGA